MVAELKLKFNYRIIFVSLKKREYFCKLELIRLQLSIQVKRPLSTRTYSRSVYQRRDGSLSPGITICQPCGPCIVTNGTDLFVAVRDLMSCEADKVNTRDGIIPYLCQTLTVHCASSECETYSVMFESYL